MMQPPQKPYENFPLFASKNGQWRKDVRLNGKPKPFYFGPWADDPKGEQAVKEWLGREPGIRAGVDHLRADVSAPALTVVDMLRLVLKKKQADYELKKLSAETLRGYIIEYNEFGGFMGSALVAGLGPSHFAAYRRHLEEDRKLGVDRVAQSVRYVKAGFRLAKEEDWIEEIPTFGTGFAKPATDPDSKAVMALRLGVEYKEKAMWTGAEINWIIDNTEHVGIKAIVLLAANCGIGMADLARLRWRDVQGKRLTMRRGKTGISREAYLWQRTREALDEVRKLPQVVKAFGKDADAALVFLTNRGLPILRTHEKRDKDDATKIKSITVSSAGEQTFRLLVAKAKAAGIIKAGSKHTFYGLRHTYYTHAENVADLNALHRTVGHALHGQGRNYRHGHFPMERLKRIAVKVKGKLWPKAKVPDMKLVG